MDDWWKTFSKGPTSPRFLITFFFFWSVDCSLPLFDISRIAYNNQILVKGSWKVALSFTKYHHYTSFRFIYGWNTYQDSLLSSFHKYLALLGGPGHPKLLQLIYIKMVLSYDRPRISSHLSRQLFYLVLSLDHAIVTKMVAVKSKYRSDMEIEQNLVETLWIFK